MSTMRSLYITATMTRRPGLSFYVVPWWARQVYVRILLPLGWVRGAYGTVVLGRHHLLQWPVFALAAVERVLYRRIGRVGEFHWWRWSPSLDEPGYWLLRDGRRVGADPSIKPTYAMHTDVWGWSCAKP